MTVEHQHYVKRTIHVARCTCDPDRGLNFVCDSNPPREKMCPACGTWVPFVETSAVSPEYRQLLTE